MKIYRGKGVSEGIAIGRIRIYQSAKQVIARRVIADTEAELARYECAREQALTQLRDLYAKAVGTVGEEEAAIFDVHQMMLEDQNYNKTVERLICSECVNAEYAVAETGAHFAQVFASMEDAYIRERTVDIQDVSERIVGILSGRDAEGVCGAYNGTAGRSAIDEPVIIVAEDLTPSQTVQLDREKVLAFVTVQGSATSHTAILAKTMGIPAIVGVNLNVLADETTDVSHRVTVNMLLEKEMFADGTMGAVDGTEGLFYIAPDEKTLAKLAARREAQLNERVACEEFIGQKTVTTDGRKIQLGANVGSLQDLEYAIENDAEGIGLFRSEFLYLESEDYPTEEEQFQIYRKAVEAMQGKPVVIRTLDIGADKQCEYMNLASGKGSATGNSLASEKNPALGIRGIRVCLTRPEMFKTQLRALYRAAVFGNLKIMYPMITSINEIRQIKAIVQEVKNELNAEGIPYGEPEQGIMIETPAAALISERLAKEVDFFSIGTNDLTQYTLAMDRENSALDLYYDAHHPAVLRLIALTVENAHRAGISVGICGELAADKELTEDWVNLSVDELSVTPGNILPLRRLIRSLV